jgi:hypothetical protein
VLSQAPVPIAISEHDPFLREFDPAGHGDGGPPMMPPSPALNSARKLGFVVMFRNASVAGLACAPRYTPLNMPSPLTSSPQVFPPVMRRGLWWLLGLSTFMGLAAVAWVVLRGPLGVPRGFAYRYGALFLGLPPIIVLWPWWLFRTRSIRKALLESEGRLCTHCAYDVSTLEPAGTCPECGKPYDIEKDKPLWEAVGARYEDDRDTKAP